MAVKSILGLALLAQGITTGCAWEFKWSGTDNCAGAVNPISGVGSAGCTHIGSAGVFDFVLTDGCSKLYRYCRICANANNESVISP